MQPQKKGASNINGFWLEACDVVADEIEGLQVGQDQG